MHTNIVWSDLKRLLVGVTAALSLVGCAKSTVAPSLPLSDAAAGSIVLAGSVSGLSDDGMMVPLRGVTIEATNATHRRTAVSGEDGSFVVDGLSAGAWTIALTKAGYLTYAQNVTLDGDADMTFALAPNQEPRERSGPQPLRVRR